MIDLFRATPWQMTFGERTALEGILSALKPALSIEIGTAEGGSLARIAKHSEVVHSFDLVETSLPPELFSNVTFHPGDSHALLPAKLEELAAEGTNVDFALVDGDHSADGVLADMVDLLESPAVGRTVIVIHDTLNDVVRDGLLRVPYGDYDKVSHVELDMVGGHLSRSGDYRNQLWGGLGLVIVDPDQEPFPDLGFHDPFEVFSAVRTGLVAADADGEEIAPALERAYTREAAGADLGAQLAARDAQIAGITSSASWKLTAPLRRAKRELKARRS